VVDVIGLRFSLAQLRLVGYGLLGFWLVELAMALSAPDAGAIGSRLYVISQVLDLAPLLLVAIGLIAFQGGLRRHPFELYLLPLLLSLLQLLSAVHIFLAPVSLANAITLVHKQQQIGEEEINRVNQHVDRASAILEASDSIESLLTRLQSIPGLQVRVPERASVAEARREVRASLLREREQLRERILARLSNTREAFLRRALTSAGLALVVGVVLWGVHRGAVREMEQAIPFLDWVLLQSQAGPADATLQELLRFQRACMAAGWFSLLQRSARLVKRVVRSALREAPPPPDLRVGPIEDLPPPAAYPPPFLPAVVSVRFGPRPALFRGAAPLSGGTSGLEYEYERENGEGPEGQDGGESEAGESRWVRERPRILGAQRRAWFSFWDRRRRDRDYRRARAALRRMGDTALTQSEANDSETVQAPSEDLRRARKALARMADPEALERMGAMAPEREGIEQPPDPWLEDEPDLWLEEEDDLWLEDEDDPELDEPRRPGLRARIWFWFITHL
jgi:hypothetical protein